jgi:hypothetical protein
VNSEGWCCFRPDGDFRANRCTPVGGPVVSIGPKSLAASENNKVPNQNPARVSTPGNLSATAIVGVALVCLVSSCSSAPVAASRPARSGAERVVVREDFGKVLEVRVGDVLVVRPPMTAAEWQVTFDPAYLESQGTPASRRHPESSGWKFTVIRAGETSLTVSPVMRGGANPPRFTVTFHVES